MFTSLRRAQSWATLFATIAVPLTVAALGVAIQQSISTESIRKDYVQLAVGILSNQNSDSHLREYATEVLAKNSPVPFTSEVRTSLVSPGLTLLPDIAKTPMMTAPALPWIDPPPLQRLEDIDPFIENYGENMKRANDNYLALIHLRELVNKSAEIEKNYWNDVESPGLRRKQDSPDSGPTE